MIKILINKALENGSISQRIFLRQVSMQGSLEFMFDLHHYESFQHFIVRVFMSSLGGYINKFGMFQCWWLISIYLISI